jgi:hypothetical protein
MTVGRVRLHTAGDELAAALFHVPDGGNRTASQSLLDEPAGDV